MEEAEGLLSRTCRLRNERFFTPILWSCVLYLAFCVQLISGCHSHILSVVVRHSGLGVPRKAAFPKFEILLQSASRCRFCHASHQAENLNIYVTRHNRSKFGRLNI